jgi:hypothetical protein
MRKLSVLLAIAMVFVAHLVFAKAVVTTATGGVQVQTGSAAARVLRLGDEVNQGDTVFTGPASSVVMRFEDGHVAALTANSRMIVTAYQYDAQGRAGNVLLSLVNGGMRAITGLIGRTTPNRVSYRVANTTIGIRGTDANMATVPGIVVAIVNEGEISVTVGNTTVTVKAGEGVTVRTADGTFEKDAAAEVVRKLPPDLIGMFTGLQDLTDEIQRAIAATLRFDAGRNIGQAGGPQGGGPGQQSVSPH